MREEDPGRTDQGYDRVDDLFGHGQQGYDDETTRFAAIDDDVSADDVPGPPDGRRRPPAPGDRWRAIARGLGELLVTVGVVLLLFVVYELFVTDLLNKHAQTQLSDQLQQEWNDAPSSTSHDPLVTGRAFAILHIPRLGSDYRRVVVEGTGQDELSQGPGHYVGTAQPGEQGNVALAGHRVGKGSPFLDLDKLRPGDPIVVETAKSWFVYRVLGDTSTGDFGTDPSGIPGQEIVRPTDVAVIDRTPDAPATVPASGAYLTLTTCHPRFSARQRLIIHAKLDGPAISKADQPGGPAALREH
ncbi:MAG: class E sortase [Blastococcus sp.]